MAIWKGDDIDPENVQNDVEFEPENNEPPKGGDAEVKVAKLKAEVEKLKAERQEYLDGWQRSKADYVNLLKRTGEAAKVDKAQGREEAVEALFPAFDALERAKEHGDIPEGFQAITKQLEAAFAALGLEAIGAVGEAFDPVLHEALGVDATDDRNKDDSVTAVLEKGWKVDDKIIRPAKVRVAQYQAEA